MTGPESAALATWPAPVLPADHAVLTLQGYGEPLLAEIAARQIALAPSPAGQALIASMADIALAVRAAAGMRPPQASWWARLLGRDLEQQAEAQALQSRLGAVLALANQQAQRLQAEQGRSQQALATAQGAGQALLAWCAAAAPLLADLRASAPVAAEALAQRLHHLQRLAALQQTEAGQWRLLQDQDAALLARFTRLLQVLVPAWQQARNAQVLAVRADHNGQAAALQAQIDDEVAAAQARLR